MAQITTEITSSEIISDNPIHQRLLFAYIKAAEIVSGNLLEIGCGVGRGIEELQKSVENYTAIDKNETLIDKLSKQYPSYTFLSGNIPPLSSLESAAYDVVVSFQVIEHIQKDKEYLKEIHRVLKPGGKAIITTPNRLRSFTRNPWHVREYTPEQLEKLSLKYFSIVDVHGVYGNEKVEKYYKQNEESVKKYTRFDVLNMQWWLPAPLLRIPYDIHHSDYLLKEGANNSLDLFYIMHKS